MFKSNGKLDPIVFTDLAPLQVPVELGGNKFILTEASGNAAVEWKNAIMLATRMEEGKVVGLGELADSEPLLVSKCLYYADKDGGLPVRGNQADPSKLVPLNLIRSWPAKVVRKLFQRVQEISLLNETNQEETLETLDEKIAELRSRREALERTEGAGPVGNSPVATQDGYE